MGAEAWSYFVPYDEDVQRALDQLKEREFRAGRFNGNHAHPATIEEAREAGDADGTRSILDMDRIGDEPDFGVVVPLSPEKLRDLFGTDQPTRSMIEGNFDYYEDIERGQGVCMIAFEDGKPSEIHFVGYSYD